MDESLPVSTITPEVVLQRDGLLRPWLRWLGLRSPAERLLFAATVLVPFVVLSAATILEGRFAPGSVRAADARVSGGSIGGMSFLGDTMVWPLMLLVPLAMLALKRSVHATCRFYGRLGEMVSPRWRSGAPGVLESIVDDGRRALAGEGAWRWARRLAILLGLGAFLFNTLICTFPQYFHPYQRLVPGLGAEPVPLPKWDTDPRGAPLSWLTSRAWVLLLGYFWLPLIVVKLLNLVFSVRGTLSKLSRLEGALEVQSLGRDATGGFSAASRAALSFVYPVLAISLMGAMSFMKEHAMPSPHNYLFMLATLPFFALVFLPPLWCLHGVMARGRRRMLRELTGHFQLAFHAYVAALQSEGPVSPRSRELAVALHELRVSTDLVKGSPTWPFGLSILSRLLTAALVPLLAVGVRAVLPVLLRLR